MDVWKERIPCKDGKDVKCNVLEVRVYYDIGGISYATYEPKKRGYYLSVSPLVVSGCCVSYQGFTGCYKFLKEVSRQSKKAADEAVKIAQEVKQQVIDYVCTQHGIELTEAKETA